MKNLALFIFLLLAGCQATPPVVRAALPTHSSGETPSTPPAPTAAQPTDQQDKIRQQAQWIEALLSQNDALRRQVSAKPTPPIPVASVNAATQPTTEVTRPHSTPGESGDSDPALVPNADGVIDLTASAATPTEPANPFAVRTAPERPSREVQLHVSGLIAGPKACAVVNERLVEAGDTVESFRVERIEPESVLLRRGERRLRLPLSGTPVRVRLPN